MRAILTYHSLDESGSIISTAPAAFRRQVAWLTGAGVRIVPVHELLSLDGAANAVALTFDDGFMNFATHAMPVLREHGAPATVFVVAGHVGGDNRWRGRGDAGVPVLPLLSWEALGALRESGISFGGHTRAHPRLTTLDATAVEDEIGAGAELMQRELGAAPEGFAYPYGAYNGAVARAVGRRYRWACTTEFRVLSASGARTTLPRLDAWYFREPGVLERWGTPAFARWVWMRRQARRVGALVRGAPGEP